MIRRPQDDHRYAQVSASDDDASSDDNRGPAHLDGQKAPGPATRFVIAPRSAPLRWALAAVADRRNGTSTLCVRVGLAALLLPSVAFLSLAAATIARGGAGALLAGLAEPRPVGQSLPPSLPPSRPPSLQSRRWRCRLGTWTAGSPLGTCRIWVWAPHPSRAYSILGLGRLWRLHRGRRRDRSQRRHYRTQDGECLYTVPAYD